MEEEGNELQDEVGVLNCRHASDAKARDESLRGLPVRSGFVMMKKDVHWLA